MNGCSSVSTFTNKLTASQCCSAYNVLKNVSGLDYQASG